MSYDDHNLMTCRVCKESGFDHRKFVKYGVRHYAHWACYFKSGHKLEALHDWQIECIPWRVVEEFKLEDAALAAAIRLTRERGGEGARRHQP